MIYTKTCVIACFWGIGRTTFSAKENKHEGSTFCLDMDYDGTNLRAFIAQVKAERAKIAHRYILVPMDAEILMAFRENGIDHITVVPDSDDRNDWMIRWMHSGATAKMITARSSDSTIWAKRKVNEMDELKPINKSKRSNRRCANCESWTGAYILNPTKEWETSLRTCSVSGTPRYYYNSCPHFDWRKDRVYVDGTAK